MLYSLLLVLLLLFMFVLQVATWQLYRRALAGEQRSAVDTDELVGFLNRYALSIAASSNPENWLRQIASHLASTLDAASIRIYLTESGENLVLSAQAGALPQVTADVDYQLTKANRILEQLAADSVKLGQGIIGEVALSRDPLLLDDFDDPGVIRRSGMGLITSMMAVPMIIHEELLGVICVVNKRMLGRVFDSRDLFMLQSLSSQVALGGVLVQVYRDLGERQRISQELSLARDIQMSLLPSQAPSTEYFSIYADNEAALEVSGDYYDFVEIDENHLLVVLADASGKGLPACMFTAMCRSFLRAHAVRYKDDLEGLLRELNRNLFNDSDGAKFITLAMCLIDKRDNTVEYARAGHTELLIRTAAGPVQVICPDGPALGLLPDECGVQFDTFAFSWLPNTSLLLFTDGITEARNNAEQEYGLERLKEQWMAADRDPEIATHALLADVREFSESCPQTDDRTIVVLSRHDNSAV